LGAVLPLVFQTRLVARGPAALFASPPPSGSKIKKQEGATREKKKKTKTKSEKKGRGKKEMPRFTSDGEFIIIAAARRRVPQQDE